MKLSRVVTVQDVLNYLMSEGAPVSGLAMQALMNGWKPWTRVDMDIGGKIIEGYEEIREWKYSKRESVGRK